MPVDPSKTMLLIAAWPDRLVAPELVVWGLSHRPRLAVLGLGLRPCGAAFSVPVARSRIYGGEGHRGSRGEGSAGGEDG